MKTPLLDLFMKGVNQLDEQGVPKEQRVVKMEPYRFRDLFREYASQMVPAIPPQYIELIIYGYLYYAERNNGVTGVILMGVPIVIENSIKRRVS